MSFLLSEYFLIGSIVLILAVNIVSVLTGLNLTYSWIDQVCHFAGGFWAALFFIALFKYPELKRFSGIFQNKILSFILIMAFAALLGSLWEIFEFYFNAIGDLEDTINDLILDLLGSLLAAILMIGFYAPKLLKENHSNL